MTTQTHDRRSLRDKPYRLDHEQSQRERMDRQERMERATTMPKALPELLRWFEEEARFETPDALHTGHVWRDQVSAKEAEQGIKPVGASDSGAPGYDPRFRRLIESATATGTIGPTRLDHADPESARSGMVYIENAVESALGRIARSGKPLMARHLQLLAWGGFDWRKRADAIGWAHEEYEVYIREALIRLWREHREWVRSD